MKVLYVSHVRRKSMQQMNDEITYLDMIDLSFILEACVSSVKCYQKCII